MRKDLVNSNLLGKHEIVSWFYRGGEPFVMEHKNVRDDGPQGFLEITRDFIDCPKGRFVVTEVVEHPNRRDPLVEFRLDVSPSQCYVLCKPGPYGSGGRRTLIIRWQNGQADYFFDVEVGGESKGR